jgi:uncharacterized protein YukE
MAGLSQYHLSTRQQGVSCTAAVAAAAEARPLHDRRAKYLALERAGVLRGGTGALRQLALDCDAAVADLQSAWRSEAASVSARPLVEFNETTRQYQGTLEERAQELARRGKFELGDAANVRGFSESESDVFRFAVHEARTVKLRGPFRVQNEQPTRVELREAAFSNRNAWREREADPRRSDAAAQSKPSARRVPGGDRADVAARQYMHARRIRDGAPAPAKAKMHDGSAARMRFN